MERATEIELIENAPASEQVITLRSVYKFPKITIYPVKSASTGRFLGNVKQVDSFGNPILSEEERKSGEWFPTVNDFCKLEDGKAFDLTVERDKKTWDWVKHSPKIAESWEAAQRSPYAEFYVFIAEREAQKAISKVQLKYKATKFVMEDEESNKQNLYNVAKLLKNNMDGMPVTTVLEYLLGMCEKQPKQVIFVYTDSNMKNKLFLIEAIDKGVIKFSNGFYEYKDQLLGADEGQAIAWLKEASNKKIVNMISAEVFGTAGKTIRNTAK